MEEDKKIALEDKIRKRINAVGQKFKETPNIFLTEADGEFHILSELRKIKELNDLKKAKKGGKTIRLHSKISFFDEEKKKLRLRPDIVIIDPHNTDLTKGPTIRLSSKNYSIGNAKFLIELKLNKSYGKKGILKLIEKDVNKLADLINRNLCNALVVLFDKKGLLEKEDIKKLEKSKIKILYYK